VEALALIGAGAAEEVEQDDAAATFAPKVDREVARIEWTRPAAQVAAHVRGMDPVPGAWSMLDGDPVKLFRPTPWSQKEIVALDADGPQSNGGPRRPARPGDAPGDASPGEVLLADVDEGILVATEKGGVAFHEVQPPGKRRMEASDWIHGRGIEAGRRFT
jgi:methionyl-tRNA formyltransferase